MKLLVAAGLSAMVTLGCGESRTSTSAGQTSVSADDMVEISAGPFLAGCDPDRHAGCLPGDRPVREVDVPRFWMDRHEATVMEYESCVREGRCPPLSCARDSIDCAFRRMGKERHPVYGIDWHAANTYCAFRGKRLPSDAEWEKAARGPDGRSYPWGEETASCRYAVMDDGGPGCGTGETMSVCSKSQGNSPYGLCDMAGNVWEWTADEYDSSQLSNPRARHRQFRVIRGGSWVGTADVLRTWHRGWHTEGNNRGRVGVRCAK